MVESFYIYYFYRNKSQLSTLYTFCSQMCCNLGHYFMFLCWLRNHFFNWVSILSNILDILQNKYRNLHSYQESLCRFFFRRSSSLLSIVGMYYHLLSSYICWGLQLEQVASYQGLASTRSQQQKIHHSMKCMLHLSRCRFCNSG